MRLRAFAVVVALGSAVLSASPAEAAAAARPYDFNGDGFPELVVGAPDLQVGSVPRAGGVVVLPASSRGLSLTETVISQSSRGVPGASETGDRFGDAVASADFDRDGYADLAVGQPRENDEAGAVTVVYGSSRGLDTIRSRRVGPVSAGGFGSALVAGDFNRDGFADLAVGAPRAAFYRVGEEGNIDDPYVSGTVTVLSGGSTGLSSADPVVLRRQGGNDFDSNFGADLAAGDLDQDGTTDLIVLSRGIVGEHARNPGSISYCLGRAGGPADCTRLLHHGNYANGASMAVGNMSGDSRPEIVVGVPFGDLDDLPGDRVEILKLGAGMPLTVARQQTLTQSSRGVPGTSEGDAFGSSVALGDIDRDGYADLVIGAPGENGGADGGEGRVTVVHGAAAGWRTNGNYSYSQNTRGIPGVAESGDGFGSDVSLRDHNRDGRLDLAMSAAGENSFLNADAETISSGAITTLRGSGRGFTTTGARTFGLASLGYPHPAGAQFGATLGNKSAPSPHAAV